MNSFRARRVVRFSQCDPAGIIFYPRYFEIVQEVTEDWFRDVLELPYADLMFSLKRGFPMRNLEADFLAPSRLGDCLDISLAVTHLGSTSLHVAYDISCAGDARAVITTVAVHTDIGTGRPVPIEGDLRSNLENYRGVSR